MAVAHCGTDSCWRVATGRMIAVQHRRNHAPVGEFVIPELLGGPDAAMIGRVLWNEFFANRDWRVASAVAVAMLLALVLPIMFFQRYQSRGGHP